MSKSYVLNIKIVSVFDHMCGMQDLLDRKSCAGKNADHVVYLICAVNGVDGGKERRGVYVCMC